MEHSTELLHHVARPCPALGPEAALGLTAHHLGREASPVALLGWAGWGRHPGAGRVLMQGAVLQWRWAASTHCKKMQA